VRSVRCGPSAPRASRRRPPSSLSPN
jgi:hypothetical protein